MAAAREAFDTAWHNAHPMQATSSERGPDLGESAPIWPLLSISVADKLMDRMIALMAGVLSRHNDSWREQRNQLATEYRLWKTQTADACRIAEMDYQISDKRSTAASVDLRESPEIDD